MGSTYLYFQSAPSPNLFTSGGGVDFDMFGVTWETQNFFSGRKVESALICHAYTPNPQSGAVLWP